MISVVKTLFYDLECGSTFAVFAGSKSSDLIKNILICVPKINEDLTGLNLINDRI